MYADGNYNTAGHVTAVKIPLSTFNPADGVIYHNLGIDGIGFISSRWRKDTAYLIFLNGITKVFSTSFGAFTSTTKLSRQMYLLNPYGPNHYIGIGSTFDGMNVAVVLFSATYT